MRQVYQKGKCCNSYKEEIADIYVVLIDKMKKREILCPLGNQLVEMGISKGREQGRDFLFRFTNAKLLAPSIVEHIQLDIGYLLWVLKEAPGLSQTNADWAKQMIPALAPDNCRVMKNDVSPRLGKC